MIDATIKCSLGDELLERLAAAGFDAADDIDDEE